MARAAVILALGLMPLAGPAMALTPPLPTCADRFLAPAETGNGGYEYLAFSDTLVTYRLTHDGPRRVEYVVEHCPSRDRVTATIPWSTPPTDAQWQAYGAANRVIWEAGSSDQRVTFRALEQRLRAQGLDARRHRVGYVSCACASMQAAAEPGGTN